MPEYFGAGLDDVLLYSQGSKLLGGLYRAEGSGPRPTAVLLHGVTGAELKAQWESLPPIHKIKADLDSRPTLLITGDRDELFPPSHYESLAVEVRRRKPTDHEKNLPLMPGIFARASGEGGPYPPEQRPIGARDARGA